MKGPSNRKKFVIRRTWECPLCGRRASTSGDVVSLKCDCQPRREDQPALWMRLVDEPRLLRLPAFEP